MSLAQQFTKSFTQFRCNLGSHSVSIEDEDKLYESHDKKYVAKCERCHMPLKLEIDPKDENYYFISEE